MENKIDYAKHIAAHLVEHCQKWNYNYLAQLSEHKTPGYFYRTFCKITKTYYTPIGKNLYNVTFSKDGAATVKRCGKYYNSRPIDAIVNVQDILNYLSDMEANNTKKETKVYEN